MVAIHGVRSHEDLLDFRLHAIRTEANQEAQVKVAQDNAGGY